MTSQQAATTRVPDQLGRYGDFGGRYVPETLTRALDELAAEYERAKMADPENIALVSRIEPFDDREVSRP